MKKLMIATLLATCSTFVLAGGYNNSAATTVGGYTGPTNAVAQKMSVKQAKTMPDESYVTLKGKIINHIRKDKFTFQDDTDSVVIEIDDDLWYGTTIGPADTVEIIGEVDNDGPWGKFEIEVKNMKKL